MTNSIRPSNSSARTSTALQVTSPTSPGSAAGRLCTRSVAGKNGKRLAQHNLPDPSLPPLVAHHMSVLRVESRNPFPIKANPPQGRGAKPRTGQAPGLMVELPKERREKRPVLSLPMSTIHRQTFHQQWARGDFGGLAGKILPIRSLSRGGWGTYADMADGEVWAADQGAQVLHLSLLAIRTVPLWKLKAGMIPRSHSTSSRWASERVRRSHPPGAIPAALRRGPVSCDRAGRACPGGFPSSCRDTASGWCCDGYLLTVRGAPVRFDAPPAKSRAGKRSSHALSAKICGNGENRREGRRKRS